MKHKSIRAATAMLAVTVAAATAIPALAAPSGRFSDDDGHVHEPFIEAIAARDVTRGCNPPTNDRFCPNAGVTRAQLASMLTRALDLAPAAPEFTDVDDSVHRRAIGAIQFAGISHGCDPPSNSRFCPEEVLTRGETAAFLTRAFKLEPGIADFNDVAGSVFAQDVAAIAAAGITQGCNPPANTRYCPERPTTRGELATMLGTALNLTPIKPGPDDHSAAKGDYPGQPDPGTVLWGAAVGLNDDPSRRHELPTGLVMSINRSFFQWVHVESGYLNSLVRADVGSGRLPWVSLKTPSWGEMADGGHDAEIDRMLNVLEEAGGPVWLTLHHEPEGGGGVNSPDDAGGPAAHLAMNKRVRERMNALGVENVALAPIIMTWTWNEVSGRDPNSWWDPDVYDFLGVDHYVNAESTLLNSDWQAVRDWAVEKGVDVAVGEWGMRGSDIAAGQRVRAWYAAAAGSEADAASRTVALAAYDSYADPYMGSWELTGGQLSAFQDLMSDRRTFRVGDR